MSGYAYIDIVFTIVAVCLTLRGLSRGFIKEFFLLGTPVVGIIISFLFYGQVADLLRESYLKDISGLSEFVAFIGIFLVVLLAGRIAQKILTDVITGLKLGSLNKVLGGAFGLVEGLVLMALFFFVCSIQPIFDSSELIGSSLYGKILIPLLPEFINPNTIKIPENTTTYIIKYILLMG